MPKGRYPVEYFSSAIHDKPIEHIFQDLDHFSMEYFADEEAFHSHIDAVVVLPPLHYDGQFLKGVLFTQAADFLLDRFPEIGDLFFVIANSQWCSYPKSISADAYFSCYPNADRDAWFRRTYPSRASKILLPLQDADRTHEYKMAPVKDESKAFDVVCVSRMQDLKNIPVIAAALKIFRDRYYPIRMVLIPGKPFDLNFNGLTDHEKGVWRQVQAILKFPQDYIHLVPHAGYDSDLPKYYSNAKLCVLGALIEGKNRSIFEAAMCDTPVVWFDAFNQFARGDHQPLADNVGLAAAEFTPECLAETFFEVLENRTEFAPRKSILRVSGRKNFLNEVIDRIPYYRDQLPDFVPGQHFANLWLDLATQNNYGLSLNDFTYDKSYSHSWVRGVKQIDAMLQMYTSECARRGPLIRVQPPTVIDDIDATLVSSESPFIVVGLSRQRTNWLAKMLSETGILMGHHFADERVFKDADCFEDVEFHSINESFLGLQTASYNAWRTLLWR